MKMMEDQVGKPTAAREPQASGAAYHDGECLSSYGFIINLINSNLLSFLF